MDDVVVYPNPFHDNIKIIFSNGEHHKFRIDLFDQVGRKILDVVTTSDQYELVKTGIPEGFYLLRIADEIDNRIYNTRLIRID